MKRQLLAILLLLTAGSSGSGWGAQRAANAAPGDPERSIPGALQDWQGWVLKGREFYRCPVLAGGDVASSSAHICAWPERLQLSADAHGGTFAQRWQVYSESWVPLPGDLDHWPLQARLDGGAAPLVARDGRPYVRVSAGMHALTARWSWEVRPETLSIPPETALLDLTVDGQRVVQPERADDRVTLGRQRTAVEPRQLELQIYRLIEDDVPLGLVTRLRVRAAGDAREESLGRVLPEGFLPLSLAGPLPARLESDGSLRVQVRPGVFELTLAARAALPAQSLHLPREGRVVREEVWSFAANDRLRVASAEGVAGIDPAQAQVPPPWRGFPAFRMTPESELRIVERSRGLLNSDQNRLRLRRSMWLDFNHDGWTIVDDVSGTLRRDWRIEMRAPYQLESARVSGQPLLVTQGAGAQDTGVEVRNPQIELNTIARTSHSFGSLPATGWTTNFEGAAGELHLPPGHRLLASIGTDDSPTAWLDRWGLWNLFGVLVVIVFAHWVGGVRGAVLGGLGLILTYQAAPELIWAWANLLGAIALARAAPAGQLARYVRAYRTLSFVVLAVVLVPFVWTEVRHAIYPQLEVLSFALPADEEVEVTGSRISTLQNKPAAEKEAALAGNARGAPAAPAPSQTAIRSERADVSFALNEVTVTGTVSSSNAARTLQSPAASYAPGTLVQAGPGIPAWSYSTHPFSWSGPVEPSQTVRFIVLGPLAVALWRIAGIVLLVAFFLHLARVSFGTLPSLPSALGGPTSAAAALLACVLLAPPPARAHSIPDAALLQQLRERLTEAPRCAPTCAEILDAHIRVSGDRVQAELQVSALAPLAVAVPSAGDRWQIDSVTVDAVSSLAVTRDAEAGLWVPVERGVRTLRVEGRLEGDSIRVAFPMTPRHIAVDAQGWDVAGVNAGRLVSGAVDLTRQRGAAAAASFHASQAQDFPPFVRVIREVRLDLDWSVTTTVERVAPTSAAMTVAVPLLPGESVLTEGMEVRADGTALVGLSAGDNSRTWSSSLKRADSLKVSLPVAPARTEVWRFVVSPQWRVSFTGLPATLPEDPRAAPWVFEYRPRPGETLELQVTRPTAIAGRTLAIDRAVQNVIVGRRSSENELALHYRSTQGGRQVISLPTDANVTRVSIDEMPVPIRPENGELSLPVLPGEHAVSVGWRSTKSESFRAHPDALDLHAPASNVTTSLSLPADRWPLFAVGAGVGPAFLYWGELVVFLAVAILLGRSRYSPVGVSEWLLLGLGLSTLSWSVLAVVAAWLFVLRWREKASSTAALKYWQFNTLQVALAVLTLIAVASLVFSGVRYGLLSAPDMGVAGPGSSDNTFTWFVDRTSLALPQPVVYSLPMWVYRAVMFAWALWIALALARWLRMAWRAWSAGGFWRGRA